MWTTKWPIMCECESTENNPAFVTFFAFAQVTSPAFNLSDKLTVHSFFLQPVKCLYLRLFCRHVPRGGITPTGEGFPQIKRWRNYRQASVNAHILNLIGNILTVQRVPWQKHRDGCCHLSCLCTRLFSKNTHKKTGSALTSPSFTSLKMKPLSPLFHMPLFHMFHTLEWYIEGRNGKKTAMQWNFNQRLLLL